MTSKNDTSNLGGDQEDDLAKVLAEVQKLQAQLELRELQRRIRENANEEAEEQQIDKERNQAIALKNNAFPVRPSFRLPGWGESSRALPNGILRSALFGAIGRGRRKALLRAPIDAIDGVSITYSGWRLDQGDLDVYEAVLHALRIYEMGKECRITAYSLLKIMGKTDTGKNRDLLHARLDRLRANSVVFNQSKYSYIGGLLDSAVQNKETREWIIILNPMLRALFEPDQFTVFDWEVRRALKGQPLAQWLHGFYASHAKPYPIKVGTLHKLCGSEIEKEFHFKDKMKKALDAIVKAYKESGLGSFSYKIQGDLVHIEKTPSRSQRRHLGRISKPKK